MEALIIFLSIVAIFSFILLYFSFKEKTNTIKHLKKSIDSMTEHLNKVYTEKFEQQENNIKRREELHDKIYELEKQVLSLESKIDLERMSFDEAVKESNNDFSTVTFLLELNSNLFNIDKHIETTKDKRSKEYKEVVKQKKLLLTYIESVNNQFKKYEFDIELLNNYKSLSYKDLIVFDEDINYEFSLVDTGDVDELVCTMQIKNMFSVPDEIDCIDKSNVITKEQEDFLKENNLAHDALVLDEQEDASFNYRLSLI